jgi:hypothetical protein
MTGLLEILTVGFALSLILGVVLAFILFVVYMKRKEDAVIKQFGRLSEEEVTHGRS